MVGHDFSDEYLHEVRLLFVPVVYTHLTAPCSLTPTTDQRIANTFHEVDGSLGYVKATQLTAAT